MARDLGHRPIAVILTGMGRDGADGMKEVRDEGGYTIVQDEFTSLIYSTPRFAVETNAACESLPLGEIASKLIFLSSSTQPWEKTK
jgi:two-component system chemotaxis response regulator CheB